MTKPPACSSCQFAKQSTGFCADRIPTNPKLAVVLGMPEKWDVASGKPLSGGSGYRWWKEFVWPVGLREEDILVSNVVRCYSNSGDFPTGKLGIVAQKTCEEVWGGPLREFNPNVFIVSVDPTKLFKSPNQAKFLKRAMVRVKEFIEEGKRPCLLLGPEAKAKFAPWLNGAMKQWQGHWWEGSLWS